MRKKMGHALRSIDRGLDAANTLMEWFLLYIGPMLLSAIAAFIVFVYHFDRPELSAVLYASLLCYCFATYVITLWRNKFDERTNDHDNECNDRMTDSLTNFETVKYFTNEEFELKRYSSEIQKYEGMHVAAQWSRSFMYVTQEGIMQVCVLAMLLLMSTAVLDGTANAGEFVAVQAYILTIFEPFSRLGYVYSDIAKAVVGMQNLCDLLEEKIDVVDAPNAKPARLLRALRSGEPRTPTSPVDSSIVFDNVFFHYPNQPSDKGILGVSFTIPTGTATAVIGQTGSGKTTISRLLFRFYDIHAGRILVGGEDISAITQKSLRQCIGMVPQDTVLFNDTIRFNISYGKVDATQEELEEAARKANILLFIESLEDKWDTAVGERGLKLSGGEKQRIAIARCLLKDPPVVVLDEATSALDNKTEKEVQKALKSLRGRTTLIIAHRLSTVRHADQIIVMSHGKVIERGTHDELLADPSSEYTAMWEAQTVHGTAETLGDAGRSTCGLLSNSASSSGTRPTPPPADIDDEM